MRKSIFILTTVFAATLLRAGDGEEKAREVDKLLYHLGYDDSLPRMLASMSRTLQKTYAPLNIPSDVWDQVAKALSYDEARAMSAKLYSDKLTLEEIKPANAFYESEVGRRFAQKVAEIGEQEFIDAREWSRAKTEPILRKYLSARGLLREPTQTPAQPAPNVTPPAAQEPRH